MLSHLVSQAVPILRSGDEWMLGNIFVGDVEYVERELSGRFVEEADRVRRDIKGVVINLADLYEVIVEFTGLFIIKTFIGTSDQPV